MYKINFIKIFNTSRNINRLHLYCNKGKNIIKISISNLELFRYLIKNF